VPPLFLSNAFKLVSPGNFAALEAKLSDDIAYALATARAQGRAERSKLDEAVVEAAAIAALAEYCRPTINVSWSELQAAAKAKWLRITRAALAARDAALKALSEDVE
jgi:hypothetical protein